MDRSVQLEETLAPLAQSGAIPGAVVLITGKSGVVAEAAVGFADIDQKRPMRKDSFFWVASETKPITAAAVMMLVDEGLISLDDPIENHLPELKDLWVQAEADDQHMQLTRPARSISIRELLCHMSGMQFGSKLEDTTFDRFPLSDAVLGYLMTPLRTDPGKEFSYSNMGFNTAGRIIEVVTGMSYEAFVNERLFRPLKMDDTTFRPNAEQVERLAKTYRPSEDGTRYQEIDWWVFSQPLDSPARYAVPGGGLFSTASDMSNFALMILAKGEFEGKRLLSESAVAQMSVKQTPAHIEGAYGLGWAIGEDYFEHGGAAGTLMRVYPGKEIVAQFMIQHSGLLEAGKGWIGAVEEFVKTL